MMTTCNEAPIIPIVGYLVLGDTPHLQAAECASCGARFFDRRNACASCGGLAFEIAAIPTHGQIRSFTIIHHAAEGVETPFVAAVVDCGGTSVRGNIVNTEPDPDHVWLGMEVQLTTHPIGEKKGVTAIGFGFEPVDLAGPAKA